MSKGSKPERNPAKPHLEIFVPLSACACAYQHYLDHVFEVMLPYKQLVTFEVKNAAGPDADKYEIFQSTVVVNGVEKFSQISELENYLKRTFN